MELFSYICDMYVKVIKPDTRSWSNEHIGEIFEVTLLNGTFRLKYDVTNKNGRVSYGAWFDRHEIKILNGLGFGIKYKIKKHKI